MFKRHQLSIALLLCAWLFTCFLPQASAQSERCFAETNQCISGRFAQYWEQNGGLAVFGFPITAARPETNRDTGQSYLTQWFERNRFELHPENAAPYDVLLGRLGDDRLLATGRDWRAEGRESGPQAGCLWFDQTGHNVCDQDGGLGFRQYWESHGLQDPRLSAFQRSLALFGLPLTAPRTETNSSGDTVLTQWFERARFEWHPGNPAPYKVLLGRLGDEIIKGTTSGPQLQGRIVYVASSGINTGGDLYVMNADGSNQKRLTNTNALPLERTIYAVSPVGDRLVYVSGSTLYAIRTDGSEQRVVATTTPSASELFSPAWAPDGSYVAYVLDGDIYASRIDGSAPVRITSSGDVITPGCLSWAQNGLIAYMKSGRSTNHIWVVQSNGSNPRQKGWGLCPALSPIGASIAYRNGGDFGIINLVGEGDRMLTTGRNFVRPLWSPDGTRLVSAEDGNISVVSIADGSVRQLTTGDVQDIYPAWSPDGRFIVFTSLRNNHYGTYVIGADGSNQRALPTPLDSAAPQWVR